MNLRCRNGHPVTPDNVRHRTGKRAGQTECLTCYREAAARRGRAGRPTDQWQNRARKVRKRATRLGMTVAAAGEPLTITSNGTVVYSGQLEGAEEWTDQVFEPAPPGPPPRPLVDSWAEFVALFVTEQQAAKHRPSSISLRVNHLMMLARSRPSLTPLTVTREDLTAYLSEHCDWSAQTAHSFRSTFRTFFKLMYDLGHRRDNPAQTLPAIRVPRGVPRPCPDHVVQQAFASAEDPRVRLAIRIAAETGMRRAEIAKLRKVDIEGDPGAYCVRIAGKGGHVRTVPSATVWRQPCWRAIPSTCFRHTAAGR